MFLISSIDATSNCSIPLSMIVLIISGCGLVLTAYKILPGNLFKKNLTADFMEFFLIQYTGFSGFSWFTNSSTDLNFCILNASKKNLIKKKPFLQKL